MSTDTSTADTSTTENDGAPRDSAPPAPEPAAEQASGEQDAPAADPAAQPPEAPAGDVSEDQDDTDDDGDGRGNKEAARYRRRLRDVEAERDTLKATVAALQRAEVDRLAADAGLRPAALWANGVEVGELLAEDGTVNADAVAAAVAVARETLGIPKPPPRGNFVKKEGRTVGRPAKPSGRDAMVGVVMGRDGSDG
ncbi:hypothetical protein [Mycolicibacterium iranicum]|uniref:Scaffolding protein n=1 Tax=Mycolicibacterium iranicum TaxID=912594 RepID=A0ABT4HDN8_MYCIR|nr:hypothetical protein [Mycolicibacterium iranicum]MCZ0727961.1 hypothetical protein [Mycolicibacterium iranicum]